ncbi:hypothetical protein AMECASPLE_035027, partial [Ameca splendens]
SHVGGSSLRCIIKGQLEVVPTILSLFWLISDSPLTLQPVHISKLCYHQSLTPLLYEEISNQLGLIRAVQVSSIISVPLRLTVLCTEVNVVTVCAESSCRR